MKNNLFKLLTEFGPLAIFALYYYKNKDVMEAITPFLVATILSLIIVKLSKKKNSNHSSCRVNFNNYFL